MEEPSTNDTADDDTSITFSASTVGPFAEESDVEYRNQHLDNMDSGKVRVAVNDLKITAKPEGEARWRAILMLCSEMGRTIDGFNPSVLLPSPINDTAVFLCFSTGDTGKDVFEGPYSLKTIDYPRHANAGWQYIERYHEFINSPQ